MVSIHDQKDPPVADTHGMFVGPGMAAAIAIRKQKVRFTLYCVLARKFLTLIIPELTKLLILLFLYQIIYLFITNSLEYIVLT